MLVGSIPTVYGVGLDEEKKVEEIRIMAYDLGYEDGKKEGPKYFKETSYLKAIPDDDEILLRFEKKYKEDIEPKDKSTIIEYYEKGFEKGYGETVKR